jgi:hypothetical protein
MDLVKMDVGKVDAVIRVVFADAQDAPPFRIENHSHVPLLYHQRASKITSAMPVLHPGSHANYAWDDLCSVCASKPFLKSECG